MLAAAGAPNQDAGYGELCQVPDSDSEIYEERKWAFLTAFEKNKQESMVLVR